MSAPPAMTVDKVGTIDFLIHDIDVTQVGAALRTFVERGSALTGVSLEDIDMTVRAAPAKDTYARLTLASLLKNGMKLFDAVVFLSAGAPQTLDFKSDAALTEDEVPSMARIAACLFYVYFFLLTQAKYPDMNIASTSAAVPSFLKNIMGMKENPSAYVRTICSFNITKFDPRWIKHVSFTNIGQEAYTRFGLGVAGYRMFAPFKSYEPRADFDVALQPAFTYARNVAQSEASWNVHPVTRNANLLARRGNLNKNLANLILDSFSEAQISEMVTTRMLFAPPARQVNYKEYLRWEPELTLELEEKIFPPNRV